MRENTRIAEAAQVDGRQARGEGIVRKAYPRLARTPLELAFVLSSGHRMSVGMQCEWRDGQCMTSAIDFDTFHLSFPFFSRQQASEGRAHLAPDGIRNYTATLREPHTSSTNRKKHSQDPAAQRVAPSERRDQARGWQV